VPVEERTPALEALNLALERILESDSHMDIRPKLEQAVHMFGTCLSLVNEMPDSDVYVANGLITNISTIFRTIMHEDRHTKKVSPSTFPLTVSLRRHILNIAYVLP
jgi:hypothetical protein